ncbi:MAG: MipA/OmpV family protein, partial [Opitutaceae bacterium]|nr:MipA/OmpV family protein [Opitutaceae bacterium]
MNFRIFSSSVLLVHFALVVFPFWGGAVFAVSDGGEDESVLFASRRNANQGWGITMGLRYASIPFKTEEKTVADIIPLFYYEGDRFFMRGLEGGMKLWKDNRKGVNLIGRYRFFDVPSEF